MYIVFMLKIKSVTKSVKSVTKSRYIVHTEINRRHYVEWKHESVAFVNNDFSMDAP